VEKVIVVINGKGGVGKDTICDLMAKHYKVLNISSITPIKEIAAQHGGYTYGKEDRDRKFLSDLKNAFSEYCDLPTMYLVKECEKFYQDSDAEIMFIHIREPDQIRHFMEVVTSPVKTLLIRRSDIADKVYGNTADDDAENYDYDLVYEGDGVLETIEEKFLLFWRNTLA
jgi:hypothetical protein